MRRYAAAGAMLGLACLVRPEAIAILPLFALFARGGRRNAGPGASFAARIRRSIVMAVIFAVMLLPYFFLLRAATGGWTGGSKAAVNLSSPVIWQDDLAREEYVYRLNDEGTARRIDDLARENALQIFWRQKGAIASGYPAKMGAGIGLLPLLFSSPFLLLLVPLGLIGRRWRREDRGAESLLLLLGALPVRVLSPVPRRAPLSRALSSGLPALGRSGMRGASRLVRRPCFREARRVRGARGAHIPEPRAVYGPPLRGHGKVPAARVEGDRALDRRERISRAAHTRAVRLLHQLLRGEPDGDLYSVDRRGGARPLREVSPVRAPRRRRRLFPRGETDAPLDPRRSAPRISKRSANSRAEAGGEFSSTA